MAGIAQQVRNALEGRKLKRDEIFAQLKGSLSGKHSALSTMVKRGEVKRAKGAKRSEDTFSLVAGYEPKRESSGGGRLQSSIAAVE